jgi:hypothetical protein
MEQEWLVNGKWKRMSYNNTGKDLATALAVAQGEMENAKKVSNNPHFKSKYADLATIWDAIREPLSRNGLSVLQLPCEAPDGKVGLKTILTHSSGQFIEESFFVGLKDASNPQQVGSALTYMKRYALLGVAGIASEDDDGEATVGRPAPVRQIDYTQTIKETLDKLATSSDSEARQLYAEVRNSSMQQPSKDELLVKMAALIQARMKKDAK